MIPWEIHQTNSACGTSCEFVAMVPVNSRKWKWRNGNFRFKGRKEQSQLQSVNLIFSLAMRCHWRKTFVRQQKDSEYELLIWHYGVMVVFWSPYFIELQVEVLRVLYNPCERSVSKFSNGRKGKDEWSSKVWQKVIIKSGRGLIILFCFYMCLKVYF